MSWTKRQFIKKAFSKLGLATFTFDMQPEQYQDALEDLDAMMATWNSRGIRVSYPLPSSPEDSNLDEETTVPDVANQAIFLNLATQLAPNFGKVLSRDLKVSAKDAYNNLLRDRLQINEKGFQDLPQGAGNKPWRYNTNRFLRKKEQPINTGKDGSIELY